MKVTCFYTAHCVYNFHIVVLSCVIYSLLGVHSGTSRGGEREESFPGPRDVWGAPPSLKNTENGVPDGFFLT